jgi:hypothetical protein
VAEVTHRTYSIKLDRGAENGWYCAIWGSTPARGYKRLAHAVHRSSPHQAMRLALGKLGREATERGVELL